MDRSNAWKSLVSLDNEIKMGVVLGRSPAWRPGLANWLAAQRPGHIIRLAANYHLVGGRGFERIKTLGCGLAPLNWLLRGSRRVRHSRYFTTPSKVQRSRSVGVGLRRMLGAVGPTQHMPRGLGYHLDRGYHALGECWGEVFHRCVQTSKILKLWVPP
jgi:hypothetical protein